VILLKEGTDSSQGKAQLISNINACMAVVDTVATTLGPRGMDKLIHNDKVQQAGCILELNFTMCCCFLLPKCLWLDYFRINLLPRQ
jgi:hypothetical protein